MHDWRQRSEKLHLWIEAGQPANEGVMCKDLSVRGYALCLKQKSLYQECG
jgi:hypothetical protein